MSFSLAGAMLFATAVMAGEGDAARDARVVQGFSVPPDVLAIAGDSEYGAYLSNECTGCHRIGGENDGIPGIVGWSEEAFVTALHAYREKHRGHPAMQMIAARLTNEEIAALAAYFAGLGG